MRKTGNEVKVETKKYIDNTLELWLWELQMKKVDKRVSLSSYLYLMGREFCIF